MKSGFYSEYLTFDNKELYVELGRHIAYYRKRAHLTQKELAKRIGITRPYMCQIEHFHNDQPFSMEVLFNISRALDVPPNLFFAPLPTSEPEK